MMIASFLPHHIQFMPMLSKPIHTATILSMNTAGYWLMTREYFIWNATIATLQFWTEDLDPVTLGRAAECVYTTFIYSPMSHTLHQ